MNEKDIEEQRRKVRRNLLKMAVYSIPAISTVLAAGGANAQDAVDAYYDELDAEAGAGEGSGSGSGSGRRKRRTPTGRKRYTTGLS